jgi:hypothetical protein
MASGGDSVSGFGRGDSLVAVVAVSAADVLAECVGEGVPAEVVGVVTTNVVRAETWHSTGLR